MLNVDPLRDTLHVNTSPPPPPGAWSFKGQTMQPSVDIGCKGITLKKSYEVNVNARPHTLLAQSQIAHPRTSLPVPWRPGSTRQRCGRC